MMFERIAVPILGLPIATTWVYVLPDSDHRFVMVDCGWPDEHAYRSLVNGLKGLGRDLSDLSGIVLSHHHPDHMGLAGRLVDETGCWTACHSDDAAVIKEVNDYQTNHSRLEWEIAELTKAGADEKMLVDYRESGGSAKFSEFGHLPKTEITDQQVIVAGNLEFTIHHVPGHTPGSIAISCADREWLFLGDSVLDNITPNIGSYVWPYDDKNPLRLYLNSLKVLSNLGIQQGFPSHGNNVNSVPIRCNEIIKHHHDRSGEIFDILRQNRRHGLTLFETASLVKWSRQWNSIDAMSKQLALGEVAAHLALLIEEGRAALEDGPTPRYLAKIRQA